MYLPDFDEIGENKIERIIAKQFLPNDMYLCGCGKTVKLSETLPASSSPYATPICRECAGENPPN